MKKLFKVLAIVMAIAVAVTAAACGGKEDNETATTPQVTAQPPRLPPLPQQKKVKVIEYNLTDEESMHSRR